VTARPPNRLAQLRSVSNALAATLQKHRSKTSKLIRFCSLHFRDNCGSPCTVVHLFKQKIVSQKTIFLLPWHYTAIFFVIDFLNIFTAQIVHSYMYWGKICLHTHSRRSDENVHRLEKMFSRKYHAKATWTVLLDWSFAMGALQ